MEWFVNFGNRVAGVIFAWLGPLCFLGGFIAIFGAAYGLWQSANPRSSLHNKRWVPWLVAVFGAMLLGFSDLMNLTGTTLGMEGTFGTGMSASAYQPIGTGNQFAGLSPSEAFILALRSFRLFWAAVGASICYRAILAAMGVAKGTRNHGWGVPAVLAISGSLIIRMDQVAAGLVAVLPRAF